MKFLATKTPPISSTCRRSIGCGGVRERLVSQRTGIINQIRAFLLDRGVAVRQGLRFLRAELPRMLATPPDVLSPRIVHMIEGLAEDWRRLDQRIDHLSDEITVVAQQDAGAGRCKPSSHRPIISSAIVAASAMKMHSPKVVDFAAWLGLVPSKSSTGDRTILGKISKRGNRYLRVLFVQAAWVVLIKPKSWERHGLKHWIEAAKKRLHRNVLADRARQQAGPDRLERSGSWPEALRRGRPWPQPLSLRLYTCRVCERMRRDGGSVFPAHANTGDPNGPLRPVR